MRITTKFNAEQPDKSLVCLEMEFEETSSIMRPLLLTMTNGDAVRTMLVSLIACHATSANVAEVIKELDKLLHFATHNPKDVELFKQLVYARAALKQQHIDNRTETGT